MKLQILVNAALLSLPLITCGLAQASDQVIPWATNSGGVESNHIAKVGENLNAAHQMVTKTQEGVWAMNSGSISEDEKALTDIRTTQPQSAQH
jgi:hypothetical protein